MLNWFLRWFWGPGCEDWDSYCKCDKARRLIFNDWCYHTGDYVDQDKKQLRPCLRRQGLRIRSFVTKCDTHPSIGLFSKSTEELIDFKSTVFFFVLGVKNCFISGRAHLLERRVVPFCHCLAQFQLACRLLFHTITKLTGIMASVKLSHSALLCGITWVLAVKKIYTGSFSTLKFLFFPVFHSWIGFYFYWTCLHIDLHYPDSLVLLPLTFCLWTLAIVSLFWLRSHLLVSLGPNLPLDSVAF